MFARVMNERMMSDPTKKPWAHASKISSAGTSDFSTGLPCTQLLLLVLFALLASLVLLGTGLILVGKIRNSVEMPGADKARRVMSPRKNSTVHRQHCHHSKERSMNEGATKKVM
jgi:hypothetical protein